MLQWGSGWITHPLGLLCFSHVTQSEEYVDSTYSLDVCSWLCYAQKSSKREPQQEIFLLDKWAQIVC